MEAHFPKKKKNNSQARGLFAAGGIVNHLRSVYRMEMVALSVYFNVKMTVRR